MGPWARTLFLVGGPALARLPLVLGTGDALRTSLVNIELLWIGGPRCGLCPGGCKDADLVLLPEDEHEEPLAPLRRG